MTMLPKVLLVDDKSANRYALRQILESDDVELLEADSGQQCLKSLLETSVDLILLDIRMPHIDGFECARLIRQNQQTKNIPIIFVTATDRNEKMNLEGYQHGAFDIIYKPINPTILQTKVHLFLEIARVRKSLQQQVVQLTELNEENKIMQAKIEEMAMIDYLTGVANRRKIDQEFHRLYVNAYREKQPISIMILDLDNFKGYNDFYGHLEGDKVLKATSHAIQSCLKRSMDIVGRFGGEEFMVILHNTDEEGASSVASNILTTLEDKKIKHCPTSIHPYVTLSIGIVSLIPNAHDNELEMLALCDQALYVAKEQGKNRYAIQKPNTD